MYCFNLECYRVVSMRKLKFQSDRRWRDEKLLDETEEGSRKREASPIGADNVNHLIQMLSWSFGPLSMVELTTAFTQEEVEQ